MQNNYPKPPFKNTTQPWPGLSSRMDPKPDCGEQSYIGDFRLLDKNVLITGGDSGIGRAVVIAFAREGANVVFNHLENEVEDANEVLTLLRQEGWTVYSIPGNINSESFCKTLVSKAQKILNGRINILVNCAAYQIYEPDFLETSTDTILRTYVTNVFAAFWIVKECLKDMKSGDCIINTISGQAYEPSSFLTTYASTKGALATFTKSLAKQLAGKGIRVNGVSPGPFWTPLPISGGYKKEDITTYGGESPMKRPGQPVEIAPTFVLLADNKYSSYTSGSIWGVDGGKGQSS